MFDFQKFTDNMQTYGLRQDAFAWHSRMKNAMLYVFSPNMVPTQVLRPYCYNFTGNFVDALSQTRDNLRKVIRQPEGTKLADDIHKAILPDPIGVPLDTNLISQQWSFVLIADSQHPTMGARQQAASPVIRTISTGYCSEEPVNPTTGTINHNAVLMFTKTSVTTISPMIGPQGMQTREICNNDIALIDDRIGMLTNQALFSGTPRDLVRGFSYDRLNRQQIMMPGDASLSNVKDGDGSKMISNNLSTPCIQLGDIAQAIESGIEVATTSATGTTSALTPDAMNDPIDVAIDNFNLAVPGSDVIMMRGSFDTSHPMTMQQLVMIFPNLDIFRVPVPAVNVWDSSPQNVQTKRNAMSSMLAASITNLLAASGLASIAFRYDSYAGMTGFGLGDKNGVFYPKSWSSIVPSDDAAQMKSVDQFKMYFIYNLVPVVRAIGGEFILMCSIDIVGHILIDLIYRDEYGLNPGEGWYETSGRLGGFTNPMVADMATFNTNAQQLTELAHNVSGSHLQTLSSFGFNQPVINSNMMDMQYTGDLQQQVYKAQPPMQNDYAPKPISNAPSFVTHQCAPSINTGMESIL